MPKKLCRRARHDHDNGQTSYVLLSADGFYRLAARGMSLAEMLADDAVAEIEFDLPPRQIWPQRDLNLDCCSSSIRTSYRSFASGRCAEETSASSSGTSLRTWDLSSYRSSPLWNLCPEFFEWNGGIVCRVNSCANGSINASRHRSPEESFQLTPGSHGSQPPFLYLTKAHQTTPSSPQPLAYNLTMVTRNVSDFAPTESPSSTLVLLAAVSTPSGEAQTPPR